MKQLGLSCPGQWKKKVFAAQAVNLLKQWQLRVWSHAAAIQVGFVKRGIKLKASGWELGGFGSTPSTVAAETPKDFIKYSNSWFGLFIQCRHF